MTEDASEPSNSNDCCICIVFRFQETKLPTEAFRDPYIAFDAALTNTDSDGLHDNCVTLQVRGVDVRCC